jgi:hypothetical protein
MPRRDDDEDDTVREPGGRRTGLAPRRTDPRGLDAVDPGLDSAIRRRRQRSTSDQIGLAQLTAEEAAADAADAVDAATVVERRLAAVEAQLAAAKETARKGGGVLRWLAGAAFPVAIAAAAAARDGVASTAAAKARLEEQLRALVERDVELVRTIEYLRDRLDRIAAPWTPLPLPKGTLP